MGRARGLATMALLLGGTLMKHDINLWRDEPDNITENSEEHDWKSMHTHLMNGLGSHCQDVS